MVNSHSPSSLITLVEKASLISFSFFSMTKTLPIPVHPIRQDSSVERSSSERSGLLQTFVSSVLSNSQQNSYEIFGRNSSVTGWHEIYAKKYARKPQCIPPELPLTMIVQAFRFSHAIPIQSDTSSIIWPHNDTRARHADQSADMNDLIEVLQRRRILIRKDDSLMPRQDFNPRIYPGMLLAVSCLHSLFLNNPSMATDNPAKA
jgi:hypothetical protein